MTPFLVSIFRKIAIQNMFSFVSDCNETHAHFPGDTLEKNSYIGVNVV